MSPRHVVVTGAAGGIGLAVAEAFAARGDTVTGVDARSVELSGITHAIVADLGDERCGEVIEQASRLGGPVDVLVNAAGLYPATPLDAMTAGLWDRVQHVNVRAPVLLTVALARAGRPAAVVNISSGAATRARPGAAHYCTSKAALEMATKACAVELAGRGIRVNAVAPGFVDVDSPVNPVTDTYAAALSANPIGRAGLPREVAGRRRLAGLRCGGVRHRCRVARRRRGHRRHRGAAPAPHRHDRAAERGHLKESTAWQRRHGRT